METIIMDYIGYIYTYMYMIGFLGSPERSLLLRVGFGVWVHGFNC